MDIKEKALALKKDAEFKYEALTKYIAAIQPKISEYDKSRESVSKVMQKDKNQDGVAACSGLGIALDQVQSYSKGAL